jgi:hypothetical protein
MSGLDDDSEGLSLQRVPGLRAAQGTLVRLPDAPESVLPALGYDQAIYLSFLMEGRGLEEASELFTAGYGKTPPVEEWTRDPEFTEALGMLQSDRPLLFRALSLALFGKAYRTISMMMDGPKTAGKAVELLARLHGMLIDKTRNENPEEVKQLLRTFVTPYTQLKQGDS